jgi:iron complex outermembrane receptor protein
MHTEFEGGEPGTTFEKEAWEARLEATHQRAGGGGGVWGLHGWQEDFAAAGFEAFVPPSETRQLAAFVFEDFRLMEALSVELGGRVEHQAIDVDAAAPDFNDTALSLSAGLVQAWGDQGWSTALHLHRTERLPTATELYADGLHAATQAFEIGDPGLEKEVATGLEASVRRTAGRITGAASLFVTSYDDYISLEPTGEEKEGSAVFAIRAREALFYGGEAEMVLHLHDGDRHALDLTLGADLVRGRETETETDLPRIPPWSLRAELRNQSGRLDWGLVARYTAEQDHTAPFEEPTAAYTLVAADVAYRVPLAEGLDLTLFAAVDNLFDEIARNHASFTKEEVPLAGRNVQAGLRLEF